MTELRIETTADGSPPSFCGLTSDLVYFLSFAVAERYGATHELSGVAKILRGEMAPNLRALLTFAEDNPGDAADLSDMEQIWQDAAPVAAAARWVASEIQASSVLLQLTQEFPRLVASLQELAGIADWTAARGGRVRMLFRL